MSKLKLKIGVVMDPIGSISPKKDSSLAMLLEAKKRHHEIYYMEQKDLRLIKGEAKANASIIDVHDDDASWFNIKEEAAINLADLDVILMRKDPPFDMEFIYTTYILERAEDQGVLVINKPNALRDMNEKVYTAWFPDYAPTTLITRSMSEIKSFLEVHNKIVIKPLDGMGGASIFRVTAGDANASVIYETLTNHGTTFCMVQNYIPEILQGDKRILMIDGEPVPYALARVPSAGELRGNLAAGGQGRGQPLSDRDREICAVVGPELKRRGLIFVGLDVIGNYLTEINVTSPTCMRELESQFDIAIADQLMECIAGHLKR